LRRESGDRGLRLTTDAGVHHRRARTTQEDTMATTRDLRPSETPFDRFLTASAGDDPGGRAVSVLSFLARLGVDPWEEAASLSRMAPERARQHLADLMQRQGDLVGVPGTLVSHTRHLISLLPGAPSEATPRPRRDADLLLDLRPGLATNVAVVIAVLALARWFMGA
jgi:hypothetical protein